MFNPDEPLTNEYLATLAANIAADNTEWLDQLSDNELFFNAREGILINEKNETTLTTIIVATVLQINRHQAEPDQQTQCDALYTLLDHIKTAINDKRAVDLPHLNSEQDDVAVISHYIDENNSKLQALFRSNQQDANDYVGIIIGLIDPDVIAQAKIRHEKYQTEQRDIQDINQAVQESQHKEIARLDAKKLQETTQALEEYENSKKEESTEETEEPKAPAKRITEQVNILANTAIGSAQKLMARVNPKPSTNDHVDSDILYQPTKLGIGTQIEQTFQQSWKQGQRTVTDLFSTEDHAEYRVLRSVIITIGKIVFNATEDPNGSGKVICKNNILQKCLNKRTKIENDYLLLIPRTSTSDGLDTAFAFYTDKNVTGFNNIMQVIGISLSLHLIELKGKIDNFLTSHTTQDSLANECAQVQNILRAIHDVLSSENTCNNPAQDIKNILQNETVLSENQALQQKLLACVETFIANKGLYAYMQTSLQSGSNPDTTDLAFSPGNIYIYADDPSKVMAHVYHNKKKQEKLQPPGQAKDRQPSSKNNQLSFHGQYEEKLAAKSQCDVTLPSSEELSNAAQYFDLLKTFSYGTVFSRTTSTTSAHSDESSVQSVEKSTADLGETPQAITPSALKFIIPKIWANQKVKVLLSNLKQKNNIKLKNIKRDNINFQLTFNGDQLNDDMQNVLNRCYNAHDIRDDIKSLIFLYCLELFNISQQTDPEFTVTGIEASFRDKIHSIVNGSDNDFSDISSIEKDFLLSIINRHEKPTKLAPSPPATSVNTLFYAGAQYAQEMGAATKQFVKKQTHELAQQRTMSKQFTWRTSDVQQLLALISGGGVNLRQHGITALIADHFKLHQNGKECLIQMPMYYISSDCLGTLSFNFSEQKSEQLHLIQVIGFALTLEINYRNTFKIEFSKEDISTLRVIVGLLSRCFDNSPSERVDQFLTEYELYKKIKTLEYNEKYEQASLWQKATLLAPAKESDFTKRIIDYIAKNKNKFKDLSVDDTTIAQKCFTTLKTALTTNDIYMPVPYKEGPKMSI